MIPPLSYILIPAAITFFGAFMGSVLATFIAPRLQHRFWKHQRLEDLRFMVITDINKLAAEFIVSYLGKEMPEFIPPLTPAFFQSWQVLEGQVKVLFSHSTFQAFTRMHEMTLSFGFYSRQELIDRAPRINQFKEARNTALNAFYKEIGIL